MLRATQPPGQYGNVRNDFYPDAYVQLVKTKGYPAIWEKAIVCPNRIVDVHQHVVGCDVCNGKGFLYFDPQPQKLVITSLSLKETWHEIGRFDLGTGLITTEVRIPISYWDRITLPESSVRYTEPVKRTHTNTDTLKYTPLVPTTEATIKLFKKVIFAQVVDQNKVVYEYGTDFTFVGNTIVWNAPAKILPETFYSIAYFLHPVYIVMDLVHHFRDTPLANPQTTGLKRPQPDHDLQANMPTQAVAMLEFLIGDESRIQNPNGQQGAGPDRIGIK